MICANFINYKCLLKTILVRDALVVESLLLAVLLHLEEIMFFVRSWNKPVLHPVAWDQEGHRAQRRSKAAQPGTEPRAASASMASTRLLTAASTVEG